MGYVISIILSVVSGILLYILQGVIKENKQLHKEKKQKVEAREKAISDGVMSLLRIQLIEYHDKYMTKDVIPVYVYENWDDMYSSYAALGGNGSIKRMNDDLNKIRLGGGQK